MCNVCNVFYFSVTGLLVILCFYEHFLIGVGFDYSNSPCLYKDMGAISCSQPTASLKQVHPQTGDAGNWYNLDYGR